MRTLVLLSVAAASLAGCASSEEYVASRSNFDVCRLSMRGPHARNADAEAARRGLDCRQYYGAIAAQQAADAAALSNLQRTLNPPQRQLVAPQQCVSRWIGNNVYTDCQ